MTGFARVDGRAAGKSWIWELKSVNGRGLELRFRLPPGFDGIEAEMRALAQSKLVRGNVTINLQIAETTDAAPAYRLNDTLLDQLPALGARLDDRGRSEEHTSELQSLMRTLYAVLYLKQNTAKHPTHIDSTHIHI